MQCFIISLLALFIVGLNSVAAINKTNLFGKSFNIRIQQCREGCLEKFAIKEELCQQRPECSTSGFPPYNYNSLPDALHLLCWDECAKPPPPKINKSILETWALRTVSMLQQDSLVLVDVAWASLNTPNQCLVTWEVSGGGLMGNLLTESSNVQLSLWPDTKYRVQVTCKNKITGAMSRSLPLAIDTAEVVPATERIQQSSTKSPSSSSDIPSTSTIIPHIDITTDRIDHLNQNGNEDDFFINYRTVIEDDVTINKVHSSEVNMMGIRSLYDLRKYLLGSVIIAALLFALLVYVYICAIKSNRVPTDKKALIDDDGNASGIGATNHFGSGPSDGICSTNDPSIYSRTVHVLAV